MATNKYDVTNYIRCGLFPATDGTAIIAMLKRHANSLVRGEMTEQQAIKSITQDINSRHGSLERTLQTALVRFRRLVYKADIDNKYRSVYASSLNHPSTRRAQSDSPAVRVDVGVDGGVDVGVSANSSPARAESMDIESDYECYDDTADSVDNILTGPFSLGDTRIGLI